jgi:hypothetical protein
MHVTADRRNSAVDEFGAKSEPTRLGVDLQCPRCKLELAGPECKHCGFQIRVLNGVLHALPPERVVHHARFVEVYERSRRLMLSGGLTDEYYLGLPYSDASRQNPAQWSMRARSFDCMLRRVLKPGVPVGARILDLGAGNCWLSYRLALADYRPFAIDLLTNDADGLGANTCPNSSRASGPNLPICHFNLINFTPRFSMPRFTALKILRRPCGRLCAAADKTGL